MKLTRKELKEYIQKHGITLVRFMEDEPIPKGTKLWFGLAEDGDLSSFDDDTDNKNLEFNYDFDYHYVLCMWSNPEKLFELVEEYKFKVGDSDLPKENAITFTNGSTTILNSSNEQKGNKTMNLVGKLKQIAKSKEQKRVDKYLMMGENGFNTDGVNIILSTLMEDKEFAKKIDEKLAKIEKVEEKKK